MHVLHLNYQGLISYEIPDFKCLHSLSTTSYSVDKLFLSAIFISSIFLNHCKDVLTFLPLGKRQFQIKSVIVFPTFLSFSETFTYCPIFNIHRHLRFFVSLAYAKLQVIFLSYMKYLLVFCLYITLLLLNSKPHECWCYKLKGALLQIPICKNSSVLFKFSFFIFC